MTPEERYAAAAHRMQSAVAFDTSKTLELRGSEFMFKDQRTGINSCFSSISGLAELLISKGVFTLEEYTEATVVAMEKEADANVDRVIQKYNLPEGLNFG